MYVVAQKFLSGYLLCPPKIAALGVVDVAPLDHLRLADQFIVHDGRNPSIVSTRVGSSFFGKRFLSASGRLDVEGVCHDLDLPSSMALARIDSEEQFNRIIAEAQRLGELLIIVWAASWCRKCIYLKPKLEKLASMHYPRVRFYYVDVNAVPQRLVNRAGIVQKMPTIQLWKNGNKQEEMIGGHKAWIVVQDVHQMIENAY
ncbi:thioredoxin-like 3-2, chloroplastic isoform X1 [Nymphaea colorata]|nr:thioredoxin-like 3-2, chloroplastic isoform X1 [Nymphaea colorata]XP_049933179.1 thioredoxin-like 3-2, chloroplastic isoform X1 [Nymphaea colorata]